ncbi:MAG: DUF1028 domain-containing protein [Rhodobacteraceae bacterium]|nr:DUF1028 domain-containing protein [Paracoccaceae bacterium]MYF46715.1 DUF1028 domain-containing protein [Paracoccaceae bacterium]MYI90513.1 DUF1028 domain-containing protein [Paracoccaceae bacterium]
MTFSIAGYCSKTNQLGIAITTSSIAVGSRCPWARAGVGAVSSQNITLPSIGNMVLDRIEAGAYAPEGLSSVIDDMEFKEYRQVIAIDTKGNTAHFCGKFTLGTNSYEHGLNCIAAGNLLRSTKLPGVMNETFENNSSATLPERLLMSLESGLYEGGGEMGPTHSASLLVVDKEPWPLVDLRVDWNDVDPVKELRELWTAYEPQMLDYLLRAKDPEGAPSFGVPGDE